LGCEPKEVTCGPGPRGKANRGFTGPSARRLQREILSRRSVSCGIVVGRTWTWDPCSNRPAVVRRNLFDSRSRWRFWKGAARDRDLEMRPGPAGSLLWSVEGPGSGETGTGAEAGRRPFSRTTRQGGGGGNREPAVRRSSRPHEAAVRGDRIGCARLAGRVRAISAWPKAAQFHGRLPRRITRARSRERDRGCPLVSRAEPRAFARRDLRAHRLRKSSRSPHASADADARPATAECLAPEESRAPERASEVLAGDDGGRSSPVADLSWFRTAPRTPRRRTRLGSRRLTSVSWTLS
jgi:hypothetical protein